MCIVRGRQPHGVRKDGASWRVTTDEVLQLQLEGRRHILDPKRQVREVVPDAVGRREHLIGGDLVVDVSQHVEHLATV